MGHYDTTMIGICTGGVFSRPKDMDDIRRRISRVISEMGTSEVDIDPGNIRCLSQELEAHKGSIVVIGGVFNYWEWKRTSAFACRLSAEFGTEVLCMTWCEDGAITCGVFLGGQPLADANENPQASIIRRIAQ